MSDSLSSIIFPTYNNSQFAASLASHVASSSGSSSSASSSSGSTSSSSSSSVPRKIYGRQKRNATSADLVDVEPKLSSLSPSFTATNHNSTAFGSMIPVSMSFVDNERSSIAAAATAAGDAIHQFQGATKRALDEQSRMSSHDDRATGSFVVGDELSFIDMIERFAVTGVTESSTTDIPAQRCPLCPRYLPIADFASHVYVCMRDAEDAELAQRLAAESGASQSTDEYKPVDICPEGATCGRTDANHFIMLQHPLCTCPCCGEEWPVFEINAHLTLCLTKGDFSRGIGGGTTTTRGGLDLGSSMSTSADGASSSSSSSLSSWRAPSSSSSSSSNGSSGPKLSVPLSRAQMSAMANLVVRKKEKEKGDRLPVARSRSAGELKLSSTPSEADKADEASISQLLDTFAHLGFNKDALQRVMQEDAAALNGSNAHNHHGHAHGHGIAAAAANTAERASSPPSAISVTPMSTMMDNASSSASSSFGTDWSSSSMSSITVPQPITSPGVMSPLLHPLSSSSLQQQPITLSPLRAPKVVMPSFTSLASPARLTALSSLSVIGLPASSSPSPPPHISPGLTIITTLPTSLSAPPPPNHI